MGNMSNPSINRWGLNLFWYKHWYNDTNYSLFLQHDTAFMKLLHTFLNFGIQFPTNIFVNKYWFKKIKKENYFNTHNTKYYRVIKFKNLITKELSYHNERIRITNIYQSKIWILKFQHWIILNFYCFNPVKKRQKKKIFKSNIEVDGYSFSQSRHFETYKRIKFIFVYMFKNFFRKPVYYKF